MTFFKKVEAWFKKVFKNVPAYDKIVSATLTIVAPMIETVLALTGNEACAAAIALVVGKIQADLAVVAVTVQGAEASPSLTGVLADIKTNLASLLSAGQIKDPATLAKVIAIVNGVIAELDDIAAVLPTPAVAT